MAKSLYLGKKSLPTFEEMCRELLAWHAYASRDPETFRANLEWYITARGECQTLGDKYTLTLHQTCQVVAAISPGKKWGINLRDAELIIQAWRLYATEVERFSYLLEYHFQTGYTWENARNAFTILDTGADIPSERTKTFAFAANLEFPGLTDLVTIDLHMAHILGKTRQRGPVNVGAVYDLLVEPVRFVARLLGITPDQLQSLVWGTRVAAFEAGYDADTLCDLIASIELVERA